MKIYGNWIYIEDARIAININYVTQIRAEKNNIILNTADDYEYIAQYDSVVQAQKVLTEFLVYLENYDSTIKVKNID